MRYRFLPVAILTFGALFGFSTLCAEAAIRVGAWHIQSLSIPHSSSNGLQKSDVDCLVDGATVPNGTSRSFYNVDSVITGQLCSDHAVNRTCLAGYLSGDSSYSHASCTVDPCSSRSSIFKDACASTPFTSEFDDLQTDSSGAWLDPSDKSSPATYTISTAADLSALIPSLVPGDIVEVNDGTWSGAVVGITLYGTKAGPITIRAKHQGGVILTGGSRISMNGAFLRFEGFKFTGSFSTTDGSAALTLGNSSPGCQHCTASDIAFDGYNPPDLNTRTFYVSISGQWNRLTRSSLIGKYSHGSTVSASGSRALSGADYYLIDNNYFKDRPDGLALLGLDNGFETIAMYSSYKGMVTQSNGPYWADSHSFVRNNFFEDVNGEGEVITLKASKIAIQNNTFNRSGWAVTARASNYSIVENNVFTSSIDDSEPIGGVRLYGTGHVVVNNIFQFLNYQGHASAFPLGLGLGDVDPFVANEYIPVTNGLFAFNLFANNKTNLKIGVNQTGTTIAPSLSQFAYNVIQQGSTTDASNSIYIVPGSTVSIHDNIFATGTTTVSGFQNMATDAATFSATSSLYQASSAYSYLRQADRRLFKSLFDQSALSTVEKTDILYRLEHINSQPQSPISFDFYTDADVGSTIGARTY